MIKQTVRRIMSAPKILRAKQALASLDDGDYVTENVPYECQFASPELAKDILERKIDAKNDPNWQRFGFETEEEAGYWAPRLCGICCIKMAVDHYYGADTTIAGLAQEGVVLGGYNIEADLGWYYAPLVALAEAHGVSGSVQAHLSTNEIAALVSRERLVIASANPEIIRGDTTIRSTKKSGHLVLVVGVRMENHKIIGFYLHNPSGKSADMQRYAFIPLQTFVEAYGERGIVLEKSQPR